MVSRRNVLKILASAPLIGVVQPKPFDLFDIVHNKREDLLGFYAPDRYMFYKTHNWTGDYHQFIRENYKWFIPYDNCTQNDYDYPLVRPVDLTNRDDFYKLHTEIVSRYETWLVDPQSVFDQNYHFKRGV